MIYENKKLKSLHLLCLALPEIQIWLKEVDRKLIGAAGCTTCSLKKKGEKTTIKDLPHPELDDPCHLAQFYLS
jgi:hypothetical protein